MIRRTKLLVALVGLAAVVAAVPWLVPLSGFIPEIEETAARRLGQPVRVGDLRLALLPVPHVTALDVSIGEEPIGQVGRIKIYPALTELLSEVKVLREVRLEEVVVTQVLAAGLLALPRSDQPARARVRRIVLERGELRLDAATLRDVRVTVDLDEDGRVVDVHADSGGRLRIGARPGDGSTWMLEVAARSWTPPAGPKLLFDRIDASAVLNRHGVETRDVVARLYGGRAAGALKLGWQGGWSVGGDIAVEQVKLQPLASIVADNRGISGRISGKPGFSMRAKRAGDLFASLELASDFVIEEGTLHKVDLVAAARNPLAAKPKDGETRFDELSGHVEIDAQGYHFSGIKVASGLLRATGQVSVARDRTLDGRIDAELRGTASLLTVPLQVSGTVQDPSVAPTKTAMAGAVAGSVLLPGIGTAIGLKASQLTDRLFNKRRTPAPAKPNEESPSSGR
jgi:uncharacterized protein involved in outer membrane biogenesis